MYISDAPNAESVNVGVKFEVLEFPPSIEIEVELGAILSCVIVSLIQLDSFPAESLNFTYTVAIALVCASVQDFDVAYVSQLPSEEQPEVFVIYISLAATAASVSVGVEVEVLELPASMVIEVDAGATLSWVMVSLMQLDSFPAASLNFAYTVAVAFDCPRVHDFEVVYVSQLPSEEQPIVLVMLTLVKSSKYWSFRCQLQSRLKLVRCYRESWYR